MSLRRSARVASSTAPAAPGVNGQNGVTENGKASKSKAPAKKRKASKAAPESQPPQDPTKNTIVTTDTGEHLEQSNSDITPPSNTATTPAPKKRKSKSTAKPAGNPPPATPPAVGLVSKENTGSPLPDPSDKMLSKQAPRPAEPHATNAPLATPNGSHTIEAYGSPTVKPPDATPARKRKAKDPVAPDVGAIPSPTTDIDRLLKDAEAHLVSVDPALKPLVEKHQCKMFSPEGLREVVDPFTRLSTGIIGQQVCLFLFSLFFFFVTSHVLHTKTHVK